jgi:hypothetical protein
MIRWILTSVLCLDQHRRGTRALDQGGTLSRKGIQSAACAVSGKEIVPALFRGGEQLSEPRRNSRGREHGIRLQVAIGTVMPCDRALEQSQRDVLLLTETDP